MKRRVGDGEFRLYRHLAPRYNDGFSTPFTAARGMRHSPETGHRHDEGVEIRWERCGDPMEIVALREPKVRAPSALSSPSPPANLRPRVPRRHRNIEFLKRKAAGPAPAADGWDTAGRLITLRLPNIGRAGLSGDARRA